MNDAAGTGFTIEDAPAAPRTTAEGADDFVRARGATVPNHQHNLRLAFAKLAVHVAHDRFSDRLLIEGPDGAPRRHLGDPELEALYMLIDERFKFRPSLEFYLMFVRTEARRHGFHPVAEYLDGLRWDGTPRLDRWLITYGGAEDTETSARSAASSWWRPCAGFGQPGCKFDEMLVLESAQGLNKSTALRCTRRARRLVHRRPAARLRR